MDVDENFYDDFSSFIPSPDDYNLDELDEILRSTDNHLNASFDMNTFVPQNAQSFEITIRDNEPTNEYKFNFNAYPSPATSAQSSLTPPYDSQRTSSTSSSSTDEDNNFNPDDFINFLADDDLKMEHSPGDSGHETNHRGTPSPTGSCTSSIGSGTSGIQSDASSVASMTQKCSSMFVQDVKTETNDVDGLMEMQEFLPESPLPNVYTQKQDTNTSTMPTTMLPLTVPVLPVTNAASLPPVQPSVMQTTQSNGYNLLQGTLIPVKTMPLTAVTPMTAIKTPMPIKMEPMPIKMETKLTPAMTTITVKPSGTFTTVNAAKTSPPASTSGPTNSKPKTIFLSSNDFKALMAKLNTNGKGAKLNGNINGQLPKIVMKTSNGQVISNGNKIITQNGKVTTQFVPKIVKTSTSPLIIKQEPVKSGITMKTTNLPRVTTSGCSTVSSSVRPPDINIYKGIVDERTMKKQQRMIKNRESASLSRKKKKEYVVSLESRISDLEKENITLKGENASLRSQLVAFAQSCQCKNSNVSDFILNSLSINANDGGISCLNAQNQHVRIAPKPTHRSIKQRMLSTNVKKNVAVLFAMAFMVTLNVGNFQNYLSRNSAIESSAETAEEVVAASSSAVAAGRRSLLWVESETEFNAKLNRTNREAELQVPPLNFFRANRSESTLSAGGGEQQRPTTSGGGGSGSKCLMSSNQTENLRLASSLHKWIGVNDYLNLSMHEKFTNGFENHMGFKLRPSDYIDMKTYDLPLQAPGPPSARPQHQQHQKRKHQQYFERTELYGNKQRKLELTADGNNEKNSLAPFKPKISEEYMRLFKSIKRQDDTFYVLSFNTDHILLPASAYNKSTRPKMALMLPAGDPSLNGDIVLMQIDCEVVNTTEVQLKSHMIPEKLRPVKFSNAPNANDVANNETAGTPQQHSEHGHVKKPIKPEHVRSNNATVSKPFIMFVGPKQQPNRNFEEEERKRAANEKEDNKNELLQMHELKNSSLLEKMRETVEFLP